MKKLLNEREVSEIMETMEKQQIMFLTQHLKQSKKSKWLEMLAERKGIVINDGMELDEIADKVNDWVLLDILDGGYGNRPYRCECGNSLRFQYIVHHTGENKTYKLGSSCFEGYTSLSPEILRDIKNGFHHIDLFRDEILLKYKTNDFFDITPYLDAVLPVAIIQQYMAGLPLADYQIKTVLSKFREYEQETLQQEALEKQEQLMASLSTEQREFIDNELDEREAYEVIDKLEKGELSEYSLDYLRNAWVDDKIIKQLELGLPITTIQEFAIEARIRDYFKRQMRETEPTNEAITATDMNNVKQNISYEELIFRFGEKLDIVKQKESSINENLIHEWEIVKNMIVNLKNNEDFSMKLFYLKLNNILTSLGLY